MILGRYWHIDSKSKRVKIKKCSLLHISLSTIEPIIFFFNGFEWNLIYSAPLLQIVVSTVELCFALSCVALSTKTCCSTFTRNTRSVLRTRHFNLSSDQNTLLHHTLFHQEFWCSQGYEVFCTRIFNLTKNSLQLKTLFHRSSGVAGKAMEDWPTFRPNSLNPHKYPSLSIKLLSSLQIFIGRC